MSSITRHLIALCILLCITSCSSNDHPITPKTEQQKAQPEVPTPPHDKKVEGIMEEKYAEILRGFECFDNNLYIVVYKT